MTGGSPSSGRSSALLALFLCALSAGLALRTATQDSCTVDEFGNLPLTAAFWRGHLHIDPGNPPLTRWLQGVPWLVHGFPDLGAGPAELERIETSWDLGYRFEHANAADYHELLVRARGASVALLVATVLGVFLWARRLSGPLPALGAGLLAATSPNLIAHGRLVTPDIGLTAFVVWCGFALHLAIDRDAPNRRRALLAGTLAGLAVLSKFSGLLLLPFGALWLLLAGPARRAERAGIFVVAALFVIFAGYGFASPGWFRGLPLPLPAPLLAGVEAQLHEPPYPAYLAGEVREAGGFLHYYVVALLTKVPLGVLLLAALALGVTLAGRSRRTPARVLPWLLALAFFVALGFATKKNVGLRYVLPVLPLLHVAAAPLFASRLRPVAGILAGLAALTGLLASSSPLTYFNVAGELASRERPVLVDSNLDWGQALPELRAWQERENLEVVQLAYFGRVDPSRYGVQWRTLPTTPVSGPVAISTTFAVGLPYSVRMKERPFGRAESAWSEAHTWSWLADVEPDEVLGGGSIRVWKNFDPEAAGIDASRIRRRGLEPRP